MDFASVSNVLHMVLKYVCKKGNAKVLEHILKEVKHVDIHYDNEVLLFLASKYGHMAVVEVLLRYGATLPTDGLPLLAAALFGHNKVCRALEHYPSPLLDTQLVAFVLNKGIDERESWSEETVWNELVRRLECNSCYILVRNGKADVVRDRMLLYCDGDEYVTDEAYEDIEQIPQSSIMAASVGNKQLVTETLNGRVKPENIEILTNKLMSCFLDIVPLMTSV